MYELKQKAPILPDQLDLVISAALATTGDHALACAFAFGFAGFFRQSNMLPPTIRAFDASRHFTRDDVRLTHDGLEVRVKWTKTLQKYKEATAIFLPYIKGRPICPVTAYREMVLRAPTLSADQPLFSRWDGLPLTLPYVNKQWKHALCAIGVDPRPLSLHSLCRGGASAVWATGMATPVNIMRHGTWASESWRAYSHRPPPASTVVQGLAPLARQ